MTFNPESKYPTRRAYVVKVRANARPDVLSGRLENLVTGHQRDFASGQASVLFDRDSVTVKQLMESVNNAGYRATGFTQREIERH